MWQLKWFMEHNSKTRWGSHVGYRPTSTMFWGITCVSIRHVLRITCAPISHIYSYNCIMSMFWGSHVAYTYLTELTEYFFRITCVYVYHTYSLYMAYLSMCWGSHVHLHLPYIYIVNWVCFPNCITKPMHVNSSLDSPNQLVHVHVRVYSPAWHHATLGSYIPWDSIVTVHHAPDINIIIHCISVLLSMWSILSRLGFRVIFNCYISSYLMCISILIYRIII